MPLIKTRLLRNRLNALVSKRLQSAAPRDQLVEHPIDRLLLHLGRFEYAEILEVCEQRKPNLRADCGDLQFGHNQSQILHGTCSHGPSIGNESRRFVVPLVVQKIDGVFERGGSAVVVLRRDKDIAVE